ncbi:hypothetical protein [Actinotalea sp. K2]|uniref:hypothetical protein n=1 Tax=Actinotalea sp. K2 TaxID=2939438 RepID=UPI0020178BEF|nr:hypothetical protein [Actinotalea sp. K2]MCL3861925.1 hypothetical protein [Actinotalea sp. K2]
MTNTSVRPRGAPLRRAATVAAVGLSAVVLTAGPASAHGKWFADHADGGDWGFFFSPLPLAVTVAVVVVTVLWRLVARRLPRPELAVLAPLGRLAPYIPRLLGIHLGVSLLAYSVTGGFLTPSLPLDEVPGGDFAGLVQGAVGIWLITGIRLRIPALGVVLLGPPALLAAGPVALLETADTLAVALFLVILAPSDATFGRVRPSPERLRWALFFLRVFVGVALITLAFSEKFTNPELARNLLEAYPELNVFELVGIPVGVETFIVIAGGIELLFGLLVLSGALPQVAVLVAMVPFNLTLFIFGTTEVIGHLPVYGVFLALLVYGSHRETAAAVPWLPSLEDLRGGWERLRGGRVPGTAAERPAPARTVEHPSD